MTARQGQTALFLAADMRRADVVRYLLEHGARPDLKDDAGKTALDVVQGRDEGGRAGDARTKEILGLLEQAGGGSTRPSREKREASPECYARSSGPC
jgi:hypothetical protein